MIENYSYEFYLLNHSMNHLFVTVFFGTLEVYIQNIVSFIILNIAISLKDFHFSQKRCVPLCAIINTWRIRDDMRPHPGNFRPMKTLQKEEYNRCVHHSKHSI